MCVTTPTCEPASVVFQRVAAELRIAADALTQVEDHVSLLAADRALPDSVEQLQAIDRIGQQLRALEDFLDAAGQCRCGRIEIDFALGEVRLEAVRMRLSGERPPAAAMASAEPELW
jgi:hypothetical protein